MSKILIFVFFVFLVSCSQESEMERHFQSLCFNNGKELKFVNLHKEDELDTKLMLANSPIDIIGEEVLDFANDPIFSRIIKSKRELYSDFYSATIDKLYEKYKEELDSPYYQSLLNLYLINNRSNVSKSDELLSVIERELKTSSFSSYQGIYFTYNLLKHKAQLLYEQNKLMESLVVYHYLLFELMRNSKSKHLVYLRDNVLMEISQTLLKERHQEKYKLSIDYYSDRISKEMKNSFRGAMFNYYVFDGEVEENQDSIFYYLYLAKSRIRFPRDEFVLDFNMGYQYEQINRDSANYYYHHASAMFSDESCYLSKYMLLLYIQSFAKDKSEQKIIQDKMNHISDCPEAIYDKVSYIRHQYVDFNTLQISSDSIISLLTKERSIAEKIYTGYSTLHLQDYYAINCTKILNIVKDDDYIKRAKYKNFIVNLVYDTRLKEIFRMRNLYNKSLLHNIEVKNSFNNYERISQKLFKINEFKNPLAFDNIIYKELYELFQSKNQQSSKDVNNLSKEFVSLPQMDKNTIFINFLTNSDQYYYYTIFQDKLSIYSIPKVQVDSLGNALIKGIINKSEIKAITNQLKLFFEDSELDKATNIVIVPDGIIGVLPMELIFDHATNITQYHNVNQWVSSDTSYVSKDNILLASYSDSLTIKDRSVKEYIDLPFGYRECREIMDSLGLNADQLLAGSDFNLNTLLSQRIEMLHLSTHAFSNFGNKLDNYFILRTAEGESKKLYSYELTSKNIHPKIVCISACESGKGLYEVGSGVFSLSRTFVDNGTETVLKTLWAINEQATTKFMITLYSRWSKGYTFGEALLWTKKQFRKNTQYAAPYYWAGFVLEGNPDIILKNSKY